MSPNCLVRKESPILQDFSPVIKILIKRYQSPISYQCAILITRFFPLDLAGKSLVDQAIADSVVDATCDMFDAFGPIFFAPDDKKVNTLHCASYLCNL